MNTLLDLRSALRGRIHEPLPADFTDPELDTILNYAQYDVAKRLIRISQELLMTSSAFTILSGTYIYQLPSPTLQIVTITWQGKKMKRIDVSDIGVLASNANFLPTLANPYFCRVGDYVHLFPTPGTGTQGVIPTVVCYYVRRPTPLAADVDETIIPNEYLDLIIKYGVKECASKKPHLDTSLAEKQYDEGFKEVEEQWVKTKLAKEPLSGDAK